VDDNVCAKTRTAAAAIPKNNDGGNAMDASSGLTFETVIELIADGYGRIDAACPACGPSARSAVKQHQKKLRVWREQPDFVSYNCVRCGMKGWTSDSRTAGSSFRRPDLAAFQAEINRQQAEEAEERLQVALSLWRRRLPIEGSPAETYLRRGSGIYWPSTQYAGLLAGFSRASARDDCCLRYPA
jgi:hypothetical protein